jgi:glycosyltransferase involved in cell wall biosynthesis
MMLSVVIPTYQRKWALQFSLSSIKNQTYTPDEVVIVLQPSNDKSEEVISKFSDYLNIKLIVKKKTNVTDAVSAGIKASCGDIIFFLDDDAIAEEYWIEKYLRLFEILPKAGAISGIVHTAILNKKGVIKTVSKFYKEKVTCKGPHRIPLDILKDYVEFISNSGFPGRFSASSPVIRSTSLYEGNMAWRREALLGNGLEEAFKESRVGFLFGSYLACYARLNGYYTYRIIDSKIAPLIWHIKHEQSLQNRPLWSEFWRSFDVAYNYWRLKNLNIKVSFTNYVSGLFILARRNIYLRLPAFLYGLIKGCMFYHSYP